MTCSMCGETREPGQFYAASSECKPCKKARSQQNRDAAAQKLAIADRLVTALERLAGMGVQPETLLPAQAEAGAVDA